MPRAAEPQPDEQGEPTIARGASDVAPGFTSPLVAPTLPAETAPAPEPAIESTPAPEPSVERAPDITDLPPSPFGQRAPKLKRGRRNPARLWLWAGIAFASIIGLSTGAVALWGVPGWAEQWLPLAASEPDLLIELPAAEQDHRTLPNGTIYFAVHGSVVNPTDRPQRVPPIKAELRDAQGAIVYEWIIPPPVSVLPAGERRSFSQARVDIPRRAVLLTASWADPH